MQPQHASQTALAAAAARAAHLIVDSEPWIFADTVAAALLGDRAEELLGYHRAHGHVPVLAHARAQAICRARYVEDLLAARVRAGVDQYVILGAGLDSFAHRTEPDTPVRVFEVDHPATQRWKRQRAVAVPAPVAVAYVPVDFETEPIVERLYAHGFDPAAPALVSWLGTTMYLTRPAIAKTLAELATLAPGSELAVEYLLPERLRDRAGQECAELVGTILAEQGEPWLTPLAPEELAALALEQGLDLVEHIPQRAMVDEALWQRCDVLRPADLLRIARIRVGTPI